MLSHLQFKRSPSLLPLIAVSLSLASCSANSKNVNTVSLIGAGASFPAPLYQRWITDYNQVNPNVEINYQSLGSSVGIQQLIDGTVDFAGSDIGITHEQAAKVKRGAIALPMTASSVVLAYNVPNIPNHLKLSRQVYTDIFLGKITNWNDPRIANANPEVKLPNLPIQVIHRTDGSGTTSVLTEHFSAISPEWKNKIGAGRSIQWPVGIAARGNEGVTAQIQQTPGAIGYVEYVYATHNNLPVAALENKSGNYIIPTPESVAKTLEAVKLPTDTLIAFIADPIAAESYPIVTYTWLLTYKKYPDPAKAQTLQNFVNWAVTEGQKSSLELGYIPLSPKVVDQVQSAAKHIEN
ncbi:phosphate ABC transporter substrate-binding protein PstS [Calothrix sp. FACHB-1219]|uniref:phosphate ABC transporter substrate-binding protein PstS n=1 Tax=unclassified Calothrix TaxID=2619626 RepID=UPI0016886B0A|nr:MULTISPECIES: phosphate ABC transporter substrate-binding protein PstS [unclassified Calothrix]MBD2204601.1 phosphate ABC transporter substrate-binding protein PstS [Calothrix sp. FACHB-168]MBD2219399.1 phosphate ABC transporter substrate-binding protein PstS [Calothrix sp. FACHB-1219]